MATLDEGSRFAAKFFGDIVRQDDSIPGRALMAGADMATEGRACDCPDCFLALNVALALGVDRLCRLPAEAVEAELLGCGERWAAALPPDGIGDDPARYAAQYRTIAANLREKFPLE